MNKKWEGRLITLTPGSRRRVRIVGKKLAALLPWTVKAKPELNAKMPPPNAKMTPLGIGKTAFIYTTIPAVAEWRTGKTAGPDRRFHIVRNPAAGTLTKERRLTRVALKLVKSGPHS